MRNFLVGVLAGLLGIMFAVPGLAAASHPETTISGVLDVLPATPLEAGTPALRVQGYLPSTAPGETTGATMYFTGAGSDPNLAPVALFAELNTGYTGTHRTVGFRSLNFSDGLGWNVGRGNYAIEGVSHASGIDSPAHYQIGVSGTARWADTGNIGIAGLASNTNGVHTRTDQTSVGGYFRAQSSGPNKNEVGIVVVTGVDDPTFSAVPNTVLVADNQGGPNNLLVLARNGGPVLTVGPTGETTLMNTLRLSHMTSLPPCTSSDTGTLAVWNTKLWYCDGTTWSHLGA